MPQTSGPISSGTLAERQFSDVLWRGLFGDEAGVLGDLDGSSYRVTLPTNSDDVQIGSSTQDSLARVAGFLHKIPQGQTEPLTIPAASGSARTDIIVLRYDPANTGAPGPVRLARVAGTGTALPAYDDRPPGVEVLPLWSITRTPGQALSQATVARLFPRMSPLLGLAPAAPLPTSSPLDTIAMQGELSYRRQLGGGGVASWVRQTPVRHMRAQRNVDTAMASGDWLPFSSNTNWGELDPGGLRSTGATFLAPGNGWMHVTATAYFAPNAAGVRGLRLMPIDGQGIGEGAGQPYELVMGPASPSPHTTTINGSHDFDVLGGQRVQLQGYQSSGGSLIVRSVRISAMFFPA